MKPIRLAVAAVVLAILAPSTFAQKWCFVVAGDGRADPRANRPQDRNGVNIVMSKEIAQAAVAENPKFVLWTGDLAYGDAEAKTFESMLLTWRESMAPIYNRNIPLLAVRGNHEAFCHDSVEVWNKVFTGPYALPKNGPKGEENLTYYYEQGDVLILGLDEYAVGKEEINQKWMDNVLATHKKPFVFPFGHEPAFMDGVHKDTLDAHPTNRDAMWNSLINSGCHVYFAGHDHLYDHMLVSHDGDKPGAEMHQIVAGTSGAPFYKPGDYAGENTTWTVKRIKNIANTYGYVLVEIDGNKATITFKGRTAPGVYEAMDTFSYTVN